MIITAYPMASAVHCQSNPQVRPFVPTAMTSKLAYSTVQYSTVQYSTVQYSTVQYSTVQYSTVQYSTVQYSAVQYSTVPPRKAGGRRGTCE